MKKKSQNKRMLKGWMDCKFVTLGYRVGENKNVKMREK